jgi:spore cortex biosynthesis protein YabQ
MFIQGEFEMESFHLELNAFLVLFFTGMVWGGLFDLYRVFRSRIKVNKTVDLIGDLLFWILAAIVVIPLIFWANWIELRLYVWIAITLGLIMYFIFFSRLLIPIFKLFWQSLGWMPRLLINLIWRIRINLQRSRLKK